MSSHSPLPEEQLDSHTVTGCANYSGNYLSSAKRTDCIISRWLEIMMNIKMVMEDARIPMKYHELTSARGGETSYRQQCMDMVAIKLTSGMSTGVVLSVSSYRIGKPPRELIFWVDMGVEIVIDDLKRKVPTLHGTRTAVARVAVMLRNAQIDSKTIVDDNEAMFKALQSGAFCQEDEQAFRVHFAFFDFVDEKKLKKAKVLLKKAN